jgi:cytochrome c biogenesis protein CcmG, thiol:disulfide interchange protein DsbE
MSRLVLIPLALFVVLVALLAVGLGHDPHTVPSPLINKSAPDFRLAQLHEPTKSFTAKEMQGKVWLLNVWASWCVSCRDEHPLLVKLASSQTVPVYGLNYKDTREDALAWLEESGNPYVLSATDTDGRVGIEYGVYGVPETYLIDKQGVIRHKQIGPITPAILEKEILPMVKELNK